MRSFLKIIFFVGLSLISFKGRSTISILDSINLENQIATLISQTNVNPDSVLSITEQILEEEIIIKSPYFQAAFYALASNAELKKANYVRAKVFIEKSITLREQYSYLDHLGTSYTIFSDILMAMGESREGMKYLHKALELKQKSNNPYYLAGLYVTIGKAYYNLNEYDSSNFFHTEALDIYKSSDDIKGLAVTYNNLGNNKYMQDYNNEAIQFYKESYNLYISDNRFAESAIPAMNLGSVYAYLENNDSAIYYYKLSMESAGVGGNNRYLDNIYIGLAGIYNETNQPDAAMEMFQQYITYRDTIFNKEKVKAILELDKKYQTKEAQQKEAFERSEKEKAQIENKNSRLTIYLLLSAFGILGIALVFWWRNVKQKTKLSALEVDIKNQEIDTLLKTQEAKSYAALLEGQNAERERIAQDLHDQLGGTLSAVKVHFGLMDQKIEELKSENRDLFDKVEGMLSEAVQDVRRISHDLASGRITKLGLKGALEDLVGILNSAKKLEVDFFMDDSLPEFSKKKEQEIYAIIQEIISNTLKHANAETVELQLNRNDEVLNILYEDNGIGFDMEAANRKGLGLTGINNRVSNLNGNVNYDAVIGRGTIIIINIPL